MSDLEFMDADYEVISMVNRGPGAGGELPRVALHFVPEDRAPQVLAIDARIQKIREHMPLIISGMIALSFLLGIAL